MIVEEEIGRRDVVIGGGSVLGYLALKNIALGLGILGAGVEYTVNTRRTLDNLKHLLQPDPPYDAVVVLGAGNSVERGEEVPSPDGQLRAMAGVELYLKGSTNLIRFAGGGLGKTPEANILGEYAVKNAPKPIPIGIMSFDIKSKDTVTNLLQIAEWKKQDPNLKKIGVSTNAYHMPGVQVLGENLGLHLYPVIAERVLLDTGDPKLVQKVKDLYADPSFPSRIEKERARIIMLLLDAESGASRSRTDLQKQLPILKPFYDLLYRGLELAGEKMVSLEARTVI